MILVAPILPSYSAATASAFVSLGNDGYPRSMAVCNTIDQCRYVILGAESGRSDQARQPGPAPATANDQNATELLEHYWASLLRDVAKLG
jgi:hypothetical protein